MKFEVGQEVMIVSGAMSGRKATVLSREILELFTEMRWYELEIKGVFDSISYLECELEGIN